MLTDLLKDAPELATALSVSEGTAGGRYADRLSDASEEQVARDVKLIYEFRERLDRIDRVSLSAADKVGYDIVAAHLENRIGGNRFGYGGYGVSPPRPYVVNQLEGAYTFIPDFLANRHQIKSLQDAHNYVTRLGQYAKQLDQQTERVRLDASKGMVPPDFALEGALKQLRQFAALKPASTVLVQSLATRAAAAGIPEKEQKELIERAEVIVRSQVLPAYERQIKQLEALRSQAVHDAGVWRLPRGAEYYAAALKSWNTTSLTPDPIHEMGLRLVEKLEREIDSILDAQGLTKGSVGARIQKVAKDPTNLFPNTEQGRAQVMSTINDHLARLEPLLPNYFGRLAKARLEIRRVPDYIQDGAPGGYYQAPPLDNSQPGAYYINLRNTSEWPRFTLATL